MLAGETIIYTCTFLYLGESHNMATEDSMGIDHSLLRRHEGGGPQMKEGADVTAPRCREEYEASFAGVRKRRQ